MSKNQENPSIKVPAKIKLPVSRLDKSKKIKKNLVINKYKRVKKNNFYYIKSKNLKTPKRQILKRKLPKSIGTLNILHRKKNTFLTLSDIGGVIQATTSLGCLRVKGRKRRATYVFHDLAKLMKAKILKVLTAEKKAGKISKNQSKFIIYKTKGLNIRKNTIILFNAFAHLRQLKIIKFNIPGGISHNGCRPKKVRRK